MAEFLALLGSMQDLSILRLEQVLPSARSFLSSGSPDSSPKIILPHLTLLGVIAPVSAVVALLYCVKIPLKTELKLQPRPEPNPSVGDYASISSFSARRFHLCDSEPPSLPGLILRSLTMDASYNHVPSLAFSSSEHDFNSSTEELGHNAPLTIILGSENEIGLTAKRKYSESEQLRIVDEVCRSLPLTNVHSLHVVCPEQPSIAVWELILGDLDELRRKKLSHRFMPDLSAVFLPTHEPKENQGWNPICDQDRTLRHVFMPALEELEPHNIWFSSDHSEPHSDSGGMCYGSFLSMVSFRKGLLNRMVMTQCEGVAEEHN